MTNCDKCGALMVESKRIPGKWYCSAKCWLPENERNNPQSALKTQNKDVSNVSEVINKTENADSIEWRLATGKSVKVYCDINKPDEAKIKLKNAISILQSMEIEFPEVKKI